MTRSLSTTAALILSIALCMAVSVRSLASENEQEETVKLLLLSSGESQSDLHENLAVELLLAVEDVSFAQPVVDAGERRGWGETPERIMRKIYALGLLEDAQVVIDLSADNNSEPRLLLMVLFETFAVGTVQQLGGMNEQPDELALFCRALMIEARELFARGTAAEATQQGERAGRWMQFSVLSDLPDEKTPAPTAPEPEVSVEPVSFTIERPFALMPYFVFERGLVGHRGSSWWLGGGLQLQWEMTEQWLLLADLAAKGGAFPRDTAQKVEGFRIDPAIGAARRWFAGPLQFLLLAELLASFSQTTFSQEGHQTTSSFHFVPGLKTGLMIRWQLGERWALSLAGALNWYWKRWGYKDQVQDTELYNSPWLEIGGSLGAGYQF